MKLFWCTDGQPDRGVGLRPDGPRATGGARLHPQHGETDQEGWLQRAAHPEVHPQVPIAAHMRTGSHVLSGH